MMMRGYYQYQYEYDSAGRATARAVYREDDPHPDALKRHGGPQCPSRSGVYQCTLRAGHGGQQHHTWGEAAPRRVWSDA